MSEESVKAIVGLLGLVVIVAAAYYLNPPPVGGWRAWWARRPRWRDF